MRYYNKNEQYINLNVKLFSSCNKNISTYVNLHDSILILVIYSLYFVTRNTESHNEILLQARSPI